MDNFNELMRQKFDNDDPAGRFEFREEYWEQARALIEADEAKRRLQRRRRFLWWTFALALLVTAGIGWWQTTSEHPAAPGQQGDRVGQQDIPTENTYQNAAPSGSRDIQTGTSGIDDTTTGTASNTNTNNTSIAEKKTNNQPTISNNTGSKTAPSPQKPPLAKPQVTNKNGRRNNTFIAPLATDAPNRDKQTPSPLNEETPADASPASTGHDAASQPVEVSNSPVNTPSEPLSPADVSPAKIDNLLQQLFTLPLPFEPATSFKLRSIKTPAKTTPPMANQIKPVRDRRFSFGISAAAAAFKTSPDRRWLGFSGGAFGTYRLNQHWSASLGLGMRYQPGSWLDSSGVQVTESLRYSFGYTAITAERRAAGLLSLEIPLAATWHTKAFGFEAGIAPGRLLYALDRYKETKTTSLAPQKTTRNRLEKGDNAPYGIWYANTFAGVGWRFNRNISVNLRGNYRIGALVKADEGIPAIYSGLGAELGLRLRLFP